MSTRSANPLIDLENLAVAAEKAITRYVKRYADTLWDAGWSPGRDGRRGEAASLLVKRGYKEPFNIVGGTSGWINAGHSVEQAIGSDSVSGGRRLGLTFNGSPDGRVWAECSDVCSLHSRDG